MPINNPLLAMGHDLPDYSQIKAEHIEPAISVLLEQATTALNHAAKLPDQPTWENLIAPLEQANEALGRAWGVVNHLTSVADYPELRAEHAKMLPQVTAFSSAFNQNIALYERYKTLQSSSGWDALSTAQKKDIDNTLRSFRLGGAELSPKDKPIFAKIAQDLAKYCKNYSDHILDATDHFIHLEKDDSHLQGLPPEVLTAAQDLALEKKLSGFAFSLHFPSYFPIQQLADHRPLRELMYKAYVTRASELGPIYGLGSKAWDNTQLMLQILQLRQQEAHLLGLKNYATLSIVPKMANTVEEVSSFLQDFGQRAKKPAEQDLLQLQEFARKHLQLDTLEPWDITYASEKLKQKTYLFSEQEVKQYFPLDQVLKGLFHVIETVLQVKIVATNLPVWHPDVQSFQVQNQHNQTISHFYLDPYARSGKRGGAWMDDARSRQRQTNQDLQTPVAYLVCNFPAPSKNADGTHQPATIYHDDVITLFHEFGHGLHHLLTQVDTLGVSGINGVEWDAVELPSQLMENFCWDYEVIEQLSKHQDTQKPLPKDLFDKMLAAKNFQNGLFTLRQIVLASVDWELHANFDPSKANDGDILTLAKKINDAIHVLPQADISRWINTFSHIFAGGYAAGYYSYKWAEVLSADAFAAFEEELSSFGSILNPQVGIKYRQEILEVGGSRPAAESFVAFRGRPPRIDALLRHGGLMDQAS